MTTTNITYEPVENWAKMPLGISFYGDCGGVAVDSKDNVYVFNRGTDPVCVFDESGNFLRSFGHGDFDRPHGIEIDLDDNIYLVDDGTGNFIQKRNNNGDIIFTVGERGKEAPWQGGEMFNRPTDIAIHPKTGELFVSDGYGNSRVHKLTPDGKHIKSWGVPGTGNGEFSLPHNISMIGDDKVIVADRENFRVQIFDLEGNYLDQWHLHHPMSVTEGKNGDKNLYIGEMGPPDVQKGVPGLGNRIVVLTPEGEKIADLGEGLPGQNADQFVAPHGVTTDSKGNVYVGEVAWTWWGSKQEPQPLGELISLRKWIKK